MPSCLKHKPNKAVEATEFRRLTADVVRENMTRTRICACVVTGAAIVSLWGLLGGCGVFSTARATGPGDFSEEDVRLFITPGRPLGEITNRFGQARLVRTNGQYSVWHFRSGLPDIGKRVAGYIPREPLD